MWAFAYWSGSPLACIPSAMNHIRSGAQSWEWRSIEDSRHENPEIMMKTFSRARFLLNMFIKIWYAIPCTHALHTPIHCHRAQHKKLPEDRKYCFESPSVPTSSELRAKAQRKLSETDCTLSWYRSAIRFGSGSSDGILGVATIAFHRSVKPLYDKPSGVQMSAWRRRLNFRPFVLVLAIALHLASACAAWNNLCDPIFHLLASEFLEIKSLLTRANFLVSAHISYRSVSIALVNCNRQCENIHFNTIAEIRTPCGRSERWIRVLATVNTHFARHELSHIRSRLTEQYRWPKLMAWLPYNETHSLAASENVEPKNESKKKHENKKTVGVFLCSTLCCDGGFGRHLFFGPSPNGKYFVENLMHWIIQ